MRGNLRLVFVLTSALGCADGVEVERPYPANIGGTSATAWSAPDDELALPPQIDGAQSSTTGVPFTGGSSALLGSGGQHNTSGVQATGGLSPWIGLGGAQNSA